MTLSDAIISLVKVLPGQFVGEALHLVLCLDVVRAYVRAGMAVKGPALYIQGVPGTGSAVEKVNDGAGGVCWL